MDENENQDNGFDVAAEGADETSAPESTQEQDFQDAPPQKKSKLSPTMKKYLPYIVVGVFILIFAVYMIKKNSSSTTANPVDSVAASPAPTGASGTTPIVIGGGSGSSGGTTGYSTNPSTLTQLLQQQQQQNQQQLSAFSQQMHQQNQASQAATNKEIQLLSQQNSQFQSQLSQLQYSLGNIQSTLNTHNAGGQGSGASSSQKVVPISTKQLGNSQSQVNYNNGLTQTRVTNSKGQVTGFETTPTNKAPTSSVPTLTYSQYEKISGNGTRQVPAKYANAILVNG